MSIREEGRPAPHNMPIWRLQMLRDIEEAASKLLAHKRAALGLKPEANFACPVLDALDRALKGKGAR